MTATIVPDTSIIIDGKLTDLVERKKLEGTKILVAETVVDELENQANKGREIGDAGLDELKELQALQESRDIEIEFVGRRPTMEEKEQAESGRLDAMIRDIAEEHGATLYTADRVQAQVAEARGIEYKYFKKEDEHTRFSIEDYFGDEMMSVHLKENAKPKAKKGKPGEMEYVDLDDEELSNADMERLAKETFETAKKSHDGLIELNMDGATVIQMGDLRIAITRPPFSDKIEITAVRPLAKVGLDDYELSEKFEERLEETAEGILIAGAPGHGKSTFAQALAEYYNDAGRVVKTMEKPRDLQVGEDITQYSALEDDMVNTADVLLLVRPDYTVYDEVRKDEDFEVFADMRLAGVGMIGVVHASEALDAVQRLIGRVELGVIPQVVDTVVFIQNAEIAKVYKLELTVKVPTGMVEDDLARPVIQILDFETDTPEYEIYTYGEETVVIPVEEGAAAETESKTQELAREQLEHQLQQWVDNPQIEFESDDRVTLYVDEDDIPQVIGKQGKNIDKIENEVGVSITVEPRNDTLKDTVDAEVEEVGNSVAINVGSEHAGSEAQIYEGDNQLATATIGKSGQIRFSKKSDVASKILGAYAANRLNVYV
ncbi:MAG: PINc/VapC family ATPase [Candidatus Nanohaloarchaea archaeon]|nr:PINc/VapC family ATPase [Candidatus Nanohaloarchaea archaeon]